jgi:hypothetical protein
VGFERKLREKRQQALGNEEIISPLYSLYSILFVNEFIIDRLRLILVSCATDCYFLFGYFSASFGIL